MTDQIASKEIDAAAAEQNDVVVAVRFRPDGMVNTINYRPDHLSEQDWFNNLCHAAPDAYTSYAGGRGVFRIPNEQFETIRLAAQGAR